jgi:hypothetical protein
MQFVIITSDTFLYRAENGAGGDTRKGPHKKKITGLDRPLGFQEIEAHRFIDNRHMKVVRLSALRTGRLYPPRNIPGTHFC